MAKLTIIPITSAPLIDCLVKDKDSENVLYHGDSSYMANQAYAMALRNSMKPVYDKKTVPIIPAADRDMELKKNMLVLQKELMLKVPERVRNIYAAVLAGKKLDDATIELAMKFHPEYFDTVNK